MTLSAAAAGILLSVGGDSLNEVSTEEYLSGLGPTVDEYIALSPFLREEVAKLRADGWFIAYTPLEGNMNGLTHWEQKKILISDNLKGNPEKIMAVLAHEVGHAYPGKYMGDIDPPVDSESYAHWLERSLPELFQREVEAEFVQAQVRHEIIENGGPDIGAPHELITSLYERQFSGFTRDQARDFVAEASHLWEDWLPFYEQHLRSYWDENFTGSHGPSKEISSLKELEEQVAKENTELPEYPPVPYPPGPR